ncbi:zinc-finger homeodomain protein 5-like [Curcuma longa]|uniref:zinc-finger homeodomain protein 5-like n=1 Tax=Curcuma longa TaxID=136217 RepID=UPI003D9E51AF
MEFRHNPNENIGIGSSSSTAYNSSLVRGGSAFSKPTLSSSSSLVSPRAPGGGGGGLRNGHIFGHAQTPPPSTLEMAPTVIDHPPQSVAKNTDQSSISNSPPPVGASGVAASTNVKAKISAGAAEADVSAKYKECLRNHAAALGGHVLDGCGEFMPDGEPETADALRCAACGCHRSFHRREQDGSGGSSYFHGGLRLPLLLPPPPPPQAHSLHQKQFQFGSFPANPSPAAGMPGFVHFGGGNNPSGSGGTTTESSSEERIRTGTPTPAAAGAMPRKRFRTKFTAEQKEKMLAFAERIGWRIQRQDDSMVQQFCAEIGVRRQVLKVWMHNNKHATVRKPQRQPTPPPRPPSPTPPKQEQQSMVQQSNHHPQHLQ